MADEGFHEIQLSGKHLVALFMAGTVVAVVIFLCGVMVGRGVGQQRLAEQAALAAESPADPTADVQSPRFTDVPPAPAASVGTSAASDETLSYPGRLTGATPAETLRPEPREPSPASSTRPAPAPPARSTPAAPAAPDTSTPASSGDDRPRASALAEPPGSGFAVQVAAVREREEADTIARRLLTKGYPAYVMLPAGGGPRVFRVRVGKFHDRREAEKVSGRLEREEQFKPWITR